MKKIMQSVMLIATLFLFMTAQSQKTIAPAAERAGKITDWMKTNLGLSEGQVPKVQDINLKYATKMDEVRTSTLSKEEKMNTVKADDAAKDEELKGVLTEDQFKSYQAKKDEIKKKFKEKMKE